MIRLIIPGEAVPQLRPKFTRHGSFVQTYDPAKCRDYKAYVRMLAAQAWREKPIEGGVEVKIAVHRHAPASWSKTKLALALAGALRPTTKPDLDNVAKGILDAFNGVIWRDDSQIVRLEVEKWYGDRARVEVEIVELQP